MADQLPTIIGDGGRGYQAVPTVAFDQSGTPVSVSNGDIGFVAYQGASIGATSYAVLIDLSDTTNFPHDETGRIDLYSTFILIDKASNSQGSVRLGVITRIDGTSADVSLVQGVTFTNASERSITRDRIFEHPLRLGQESGELTTVLTQFKLENVTAINTGVTLPSAAGNVTPALGDVVVQFSYTSGTAYNSSVSTQYSSNESQT